MYFNKSVIQIFIIVLLSSIPISALPHNFTVVIDAGHGGKDFGALGVNSREKDINLSVAKLLGKLIEEDTDDVTVVYTRNNDKFLSLQKRAQIANDASGDLFISIHTNSIAKKAKNRKTIAGASVYTLGLHRTEENLEVAKRENSVIELENDYTTSYSGFDPNSSESYIIFELMQNKHMEQSIEFAGKVQEEFIKTANRKDRGVRQAGFLVLAATSMPSILIELDFICNPTEEKFLSSKNGQKKLATAIFNAFVDYKKHYDQTNQPNKYENLHSSTKHQVHQDDTQNKIEYKIQILTSTKKIKSNKEFKGLSPTEYYVDGNIYKYTYGCTESWDEASKLLKTIQKKFPEAFIIKTSNGKRIK